MSSKQHIAVTFFPRDSIKSAQYEYYLCFSRYIAMHSDTHSDALHLWARATHCRHIFYNLRGSIKSAQKSR